MTEHKHIAYNEAIEQTGLPQGAALKFVVAALARQAFTSADAGERPAQPEKAELIADCYDCPPETKSRHHTTAALAWRMVALSLHGDCVAWTTATRKEIDPAECERLERCAREFSIALEATTAEITTEAHRLHKILYRHHGTIQRTLAKLNHELEKQRKGERDEDSPF